jgi:FixJ family two-component response regulator
MADAPRNALIAVVDDDHRILQSLENLLESAGYSVRLFFSAAALLETPGLGEIDCVVSDINMPLVDGLELSRLLQKAKPGLPIILITGHPEMLDRSPHHRYRVFTKPFNPDELLAAVSDDILGNSTKS